MQVFCILRVLKPIEIFTDIFKSAAVIFPVRMHDNL